MCAAVMNNVIIPTNQMGMFRCTSPGKPKQAFFTAVQSNHRYLICITYVWLSCYYLTYQDYVENFNQVFSFLLKRKLTRLRI